MVGEKKLEEINEIGLRLVSQCREALSLPFEEQVRLDDQALTGEREEKNTKSNGSSKIHVLK